MEPRYIKDSIEADLADRMVFIGGPRQVGKTTLALSLLDRGQDESSPAYLNWDVLADREDILAERLPAGQTRVIFDEIHKYARWRNLMKGLFDKNKSCRFLHRHRLGASGLLSQRRRLLAGPVSLLPASSVHNNGIRAGTR